MKKLSMTAAGVACISVGGMCANVPPLKAAILAVDNSGSWATGSDTLSRMGFKMVQVANSAEPEFSILSTLSSPLGNLTFSPQVQKMNINSGWTTWSHGYTGEVYFSGWNVLTTTITLPASITAFDLYVEPNLFGIFDIAVTGIDGTSTTLLQKVSGLSGAKYFGFYATEGDLLSTIKITDRSNGAAHGFGMAEFRLASRTVAAVPESSFGLGILVFGALGTTSWLLRKRQHKV
ncbi:PEP-CTERM sorting domain-containing protein [Coleofasciculus sp. H7-2]|uniref:PEP-CTERM sorting domain-containing protein n=1 Tax=Coleofasciculus sp. H7-2 TaxID=3351545 RepID=UPI00366CBCA9